MRHGIVARIQDWLRGDERTFLIDASVFPGNSGGPVVLKPETVAVHETRAITHSLLIGMVRAYIPSQEVAVSERTGRPKVIFEENSGLADKSGANRCDPRDHEVGHKVSRSVGAEPVSSPVGRINEA